MTDFPQDPGVSGRDETRDDELAARLNTDQIPEHGPTFWSDLEVIFEGQASLDIRHAQGRSSGPILGDAFASASAGANPAPQTEVSMADVVPLTSAPSRSRMPMILSVAAAVAALAVGAAVLISRLDTNTSVDAADTAAGDAVAETPEQNADSVIDGESPSAEPDDQTNDGNAAVGADSEEVSEPGCSGAIGLEPLNAGALEGLGVPTALAKTVTAIDEAAAQCDWAGLAALTPSGFAASSNGGDPVELWAEQEAGGVGVMGELRRVLRQPYDASDQGDFYVWPAVFMNKCESFTAEDRRSLADLGYSEDDISRDCEAGLGYTGHGAGFFSSGEWSFFIIFGGD